jgi:hypothetical protein
LRTLQLQRRDEDYKEARLRLRRLKEKRKECFDAIYILHLTLIEIGEMVLLHNTMREGDMSREQKMNFRWLRLYTVKEAIALKRTYILEELNGERLGGIIAGNRLKKFHPRSAVQSEFAGLIFGYGKLLIRTSSEVESWYFDTELTESYEVE